MTSSDMTSSDTMIWEFRCHPWIHPEDAMRAVYARLSESRKNRSQRIPQQVIIEDLFIASLVNNRPWSDAQIRQLETLSRDKKFTGRFARALDTDKPPTWDRIDVLILSNWRALHINPEIQALIEAQEGKLPGLQDWSPLAIKGLFAVAKIERDGKDGTFDDWFRKRRQRLGLHANASYQIKRLTLKGDSIRIVQ